MLGIISPKDAQSVGSSRGWGARVRQLVYVYRYLLLLVVLPTALVAAYYYLIASDQYETTVDFVVRRADASGAPSGMGQLLGMNLGVSTVSTEAYMVNDYLQSNDAAAQLRQQDRLVERFRRPFIDPVSRLWQDNPSPERLLKYYNRHVTVTLDPETGITRLAVHAFTPDDAYELGGKLLRMGEEQINQLNIRTYRDQVAHARNEVDLASKSLQEAEQALTSYRRNHDDIDPEGSGKAQVTMVTNLTAGLTTARARLKAMEGLISHESPQYRATQAQVRALEAQVAGQSQRIAGGGSSIAASLGGYESLQVQRETAVRRFATATAAYETARAEAERKQTYLIRVVDANRAVKALYPERGKIVGTVFLSLIFSFAIGWMLVQGVKEHQI